MLTTFTDPANLLLVCTQVRDDLDALLFALPKRIREPLMRHPMRTSLLEVVLDLGRRPEARFLGVQGGEFLCDSEITAEDLELAEEAVGEFGSDNRAGVTGTLHRISALRSRRGALVGLTCRVGRSVSGHVDMIRDIIAQPGESILFLGAPGVGKTTVIREMARVMAEGAAGLGTTAGRRVVIVDTSNEIGGDGDVPHPAVGRARRMQVPDPTQQQHVMVEAIQNHMPQIIIVDEVGTTEEALACRTIAERGVQLVATAHGQVLENVLKNPTLTELVGGVAPVTLSDDEARSRGTQKTILERKGPVTFSVVIEMRERNHWIVHRPSDESVDMLLLGKRPIVESRRRNEAGEVEVQEIPYDNGAGEDDDRNGERYSWADQLSGISEHDALNELQRAGYLGGRGGGAMGGRRGGRRL